MKTKLLRAYHFTALLAIASICIHVVRSGHIRPPLSLLEFLSIGYIMLFLLPGMLFFSIIWILLLEFMPLPWIGYEAILILSALAGLPLMWEAAGVLAEYGCKRHILASYITFICLVLLFSFFLSVWQMAAY